MVRRQWQSLVHFYHVKSKAKKQHFMGFEYGTPALQFLRSDDTPLASEIRQKVAN